MSERPNRGKRNNQIINDYIQYNRNRAGRQSDVTRHIVARSESETEDNQQRQIDASVDEQEFDGFRLIVSKKILSADQSIEENRARYYLQKDISEPNSDSVKTEESGNGIDSDQKSDKQELVENTIDLTELEDSLKNLNPFGESEEDSDSESKDSDELNKTVEKNTTNTEETGQSSKQPKTETNIQGTSGIRKESLKSQINETQKNKKKKMTDSMLPLLVTEVPSFSGKEMPLNQFTEKIDEMFTLLDEQTDKNKLVKWIRVKLTGRAKEVVTATNANTWDQIKTALRSEMLQPISTQSASKQLSRLRQNENESIEAFGERVKKLLSLLNNSYAPTISAAALIEIRTENAKMAQTVFEDGLNNTFLKMGVMNAQKTSLADSIHEAMDKEPRWTRNRGSKDGKTHKSCNHCGKPGHIEEDCRLKAAGKSPQACEICKREGHSKYECQYNEPSTSKGWKNNSNSKERGDKYNNNKYNNNNSNGNYKNSNNNNNHKSNFNERKQQNGNNNNSNHNSNNNNGNQNSNNNNGRSERQVKTTKKENKSDKPNDKQSGDFAEAEIHSEN